MRPARVVLQVKVRVPLLEVLDLPVLCPRTPHWIACAVECNQELPGLLAY